MYMYIHVVSLCHMYLQSYIVTEHCTVVLCAACMLSSVFVYRNVSSGTRVLVEDSVPSLTPDDLRTILHSVMYQANEEPGFSPR